MSRRTSPETGRAFIAKKPTYLTLGRILPSFITLCSAACGMTAILWASRGNFSGAVMLVVIAAMLDTIDGRLARRFGTNSQFGAELDSLADSISFGVAPAFIMFFWAGAPVDRPAWAVSVIFAMAVVLRLARFNASASDGSEAEYCKNFFTGVPAPAGGMLALLPVAMYKVTEAAVFQHPSFVILNLFLVAVLLVSRVPTLSLKRVHITKEWSAAVLILLFAIILSMILFFWQTFVVIWVWYLFTIPFTIIAFLKKRAATMEKSHG